MTKKVLIVEDNSNNRLLFSEILRHNGYVVLEACDGEEGICMAKSEKPELILMDIQMPRMNGIRAIELLKKDEATRSIKVVAVTSFAMKGDREKIVAAGADDYLAKPVDTRALPETVKNLIGCGG